jgi:hypothetical protein
LSRLPETRRVFTRADGRFYEGGDRFRQPELAVTLREVAAKGASYLYSGDWAKRFVAAVRRDGGLLTLRDLEAYRVVWDEPLETTYRGACILAPGMSSIGGVDTLEALNLLERAGLKRRGHPNELPERLFWLMQIVTVHGAKVSDVQLRMKCGIIESHVGYIEQKRAPNAPRRVGPTRARAVTALTLMARGTSNGRRSAGLDSSCPKNITRRTM